MKPLITLTALCVMTTALPVRAVDVVFDYTYDSTGFFTSERRAVLDQVSRVFSLNLLDTLTAIAPSGRNAFTVDFFDPQNPFGGSKVVENFQVAADEVRIFVGTQAFSSQTLGVGGPGAYSVSGSDAFVKNAASRGETGIVDVAGGYVFPVADFAPWGGSITFGSNVAWHFDSDVSTLENFSGQFDFYTVAMHETAHVLGFGTAGSWFNQVQGDTFTGAVTSAANSGQPAALQGDGSDAHFSSSLMGSANGVQQVPLLSPFINVGRRQYMTNLDWAALDDIGWEVASQQITVPSPVPEPGNWALMLGGLLMVGSFARRRH
ncbi:MAG: PEP-CTERM sorting domain-containing protein [Methyloversatilis sp.]|jgi:hypothetical protein|nr:PEP-CTERM sorting domain-containing protein [Methyloversatilis sp.]MBP6192767.1 PEP-CTERM sorting domain-containing protein [Methyloversatilis sp.]MBP9118352.1 PEP-CTERM sorting domain-containing protein [Methyloversatilis sp.]